MKFRAMMGFSLAAVSVVSSANYAADDTGLNREQKALSIISEFADRIYQTVKPEGSSSELNGSGKADLGRVITKVAGLDFGGAVKYKKSEYQGTLRSDPLRG